MKQARLFEICSTDSVLLYCMCACNSGSSKCLQNFFRSVVFCFFTVCVRSFWHLLVCWWKQSSFFLSNGSCKMSTNISGLPLNIEFGGGAEFLFGNKKKHNVTLPSGTEWTLKNLILWMRDNILTERPELFIQDDNVRPGILVLVNDTDWELMGQGEYVLQPNDTVMFISTLHGG